MDFTLEQYSAMESAEYVEIGVMFLSGGTSTTPITVVVTPAELSPLTAMGKYVCTFIQPYVAKYCKITILSNIFSSKWLVVKGSM